jgi:PAS domain S-box-containing protein
VAHPVAQALTGGAQGGGGQDGTPLRIVIVEDNPDDAELLAYELTRAGFAPDWRRVESLPEYVEALQTGPDVVLADYSLPQFGALDALSEAQAVGDVPVIVVSGVMDEATCVECLRRGATDYLLKDRLTRLGPAVERALAQRDLRRVTSRAEQVARESEQRFRAAFDRAPIGMAVSTADERILDANPALSHLLRRTADQLRGEPFDQFVHPEDRPALAAHTKQLRCGRAGAATLELRLLDATAEPVWVLYSAALIAGVAEPGSTEGCTGQLIRQVQDITERRRAEQDRRQSMQILQGMIDNAPNAMYLRAPDGRFLIVNSAFEKLSGVHRAEVVAEHGERLLPEALAAELSARDWRCQASRQAMADEEKLNDATYLSIRYPLIDGSGVPWAVGAIYTDITDQKRIQGELAQAKDEVQRANEELSELDRMKSELVATVSHELRTPLTSIRGYTELLIDNGDTMSSTDRRMIEIIDRNGQRLLALVEDLLTFSRMDDGSFQVSADRVDLGRLVESVCSGVVPTLPPGLSLTTRIDPDLERITGDPTQLERAVLNLVSNAVKFSPDGGRISVDARRNGEHIELTVADTGIGMAPEEQTKLFQRFYRTATAQTRQIQGTGLGLALVKGIVERHGGTVRLTSAPAAGTTVTIDLPVTGPTAAAPPG